MTEYKYIHLIIIAFMIILHFSVTKSEFSEALKKLEELKKFTGESFIYNSKINQLGDPEGDPAYCNIIQLSNKYVFSHNNSEHWLYAPTEKKFEFEHIGKPPFFLYLTDDLEGQGSNVSVLFGNYYNRQMLLYHNNVKIIMEDIFSGGQLSDTEFIGFWVNWSDDKFEFGKKGNSTPFLSWQNHSPFEVKYIRIKSFDNAGIWIFEDVKPIIEYQPQMYGQLGRVNCHLSAKSLFEGISSTDFEKLLRSQQNYNNQIQTAYKHFQNNKYKKYDYLNRKLTLIKNIVQKSNETHSKIMETTDEIGKQDYFQKKLYEEIMATTLLFIKELGLFLL